MKTNSIIITTCTIALILTGCADISQTPKSEPVQKGLTEKSAIKPVSASAKEALIQLFAEKYPKYAKTVTVNINQETPDHARGGVIFETGAPGGNFLAAKIDGKWQIVFDGNGQISCDLSKYGFPAEMIADCAK